VKERLTLFRNSNLPDQAREYRRYYTEKADTALSNPEVTLASERHSSSDSPVLIRFTRLPTKFDLEQIHPQKSKRDLGRNARLLLLLGKILGNKRVGVYHDVFDNLSRHYVGSKAKATGKPRRRAISAIIGRTIDEEISQTLNRISPNFFPSRSAVVTREIPKGSGTGTRERQSKEFERIRWDETLLSRVDFVSFQEGNSGAVRVLTRDDLDEMALAIDPNYMSRKTSVVELTRDGSDKDKPNQMDEPESLSELVNEWGIATEILQKIFELIKEPPSLPLLHEALEEIGLNEKAFRRFRQIHTREGDQAFIDLLPEE
jgi:hypothetical protein